MENKNKPVYPIAEDRYEYGTNVGRFVTDTGLTKRELFAMAAMQGICAGPVDTHTLGAELTVKVAKAAIKIADELLKQLES